MTQKIVDGKVYDTKKAKQVAYTTPHTLFRTKKGSWFLCNNFFRDITPLSDEGAYEWLYENSEGDAIKKYFPGRVEDA